MAAESFFKGLDLADFSGLANAQRAECSRCGHRRRYYCYTCCIPVGTEEERAAWPTVRLPLRTVVIKHQRELPGKSTAVHARVLAPDSVELHEFPDIPNLDVASTVMLFPDASATPIEELDFSNISTVLFVDSTWNQAKQILRAPELQGLRHVSIGHVDTFFWRPQHRKPDTHLATIEAIYYFFRQMGTKQQGEYDGRYDNLLFYYAFQFQLVQEHALQRSQRFQQRKAAATAGGSDEGEGEGEDAGPWLVGSGWCFIGDEAGNCGTFWPVPGGRIEARHWLLRTGARMGLCTKLTRTTDRICCA
eukprot:m.12464 g.12464  ORF g.12464 m.12464 type:complete len:305 (+) comp3234_c0_seq2:111-1025(+)